MLVIQIQLEQMLVMSPATDLETDLNHTCFLAGLEDFENKIDSIAGNVDRDPESWLNKLYQTMSSSSSTDQDELVDTSQEGLESPILDENWGLQEQTETGTTNF